MSEDTVRIFGTDVERQDMLDVLSLAIQLEPDSRRVLRRIAERMLVGQKQYGKLDLAKDGRDWREEAVQEALDLSVYLAIDLERRK